MNKKQGIQYKHALQLHKVYNSKETGEDWIRLNFNQRISKFITTDDSRYKVGKNLLANRMTLLNNTIELCDINKSFNTNKFLKTLQQEHRGLA